MNEHLESILQKDREYNGENMAEEIFGFHRDVCYDALVVAPGWKPTKILSEDMAEVTETAGHAYVSGYEVKIGDKLLAWAQTASGACNLIDHLTVCAVLNFKKLIFVGAVGGLKSGFEVGDICTPTACIEGTMASAYLLPDIKKFVPFGTVVPACGAFIQSVVEAAEDDGVHIKPATVFCTDSICGEYYHLDFIKSFDADLIEMETSSFYRLAALMEKPAIALLVVSDNSTNGEPLLGKSREQKAKYNFGRKEIIPRLISMIVEKL